MAAISGHGEKESVESRRLQTAHQTSSAQLASEKLALDRIANLESAALIQRWLVEVAGITPVWASA